MTAVAIRRVWLQAIAVIALLIAWVADDIQGYRGNDVIIIGAIITLGLGGHVLDWIAGPGRSTAFPDVRETATFFIAPAVAMISPLAFMFGIEPFTVLVPALLTLGLIMPFAMYALFYDKRTNISEP